MAFNNDIIHQFSLKSSLSPGLDAMMIQIRELNDLGSTILDLKRNLQSSTTQNAEPPTDFKL